MGLLLHYPLTEDGVNKGVASGATLNPNFEASGIVGNNCLLTTSTGTYDSTLPMSRWNILTSDISMSCWVKFNKAEIAAIVDNLGYDSASSKTAATGVVIGSGSYGGMAIHWITNNILSSGTLSNIYLFGYIRAVNSSGGAAVVSTGNVSISFDTWYHVSLIYNRSSNLFKMYISTLSGSTQKKQVTGIRNTAVSLTNLATRYFRINASEVYGGNGPGARIPFRINDVRLYDHALSKKEVYDLSNACIANWDFEDPRIRSFDGSLDNICNWRDKSTCLSAGWTGTPVYSDGILDLTATNGWRAFMWDIGENNIGKPMTFSFDYKITNTANAGYIYIQNHESVSYGSETSRLDLTQTDWIRKTFTFSQAKRYIGFNIRGVDSTGLSLGMNVKNVKIIMSNYDSGYTEYGENPATTIFDNSGSYNNLEINTASNTAIYTPIEGCTETNAIQFPDAATSYFSREYFKCLKQDATISVWFKITSSSSTQNYILSQGRDYDADYSRRFGLNIYTNSNGTSLYVRAGTSNSAILATVSSSLVLNTWYNITVTYDGANVKTYLDGILKTTNALTGDFDWSQCSDRFVLGKMSHAYTQTSNYFPLNGSISKVKIFAKAFTASEVNSLVNSKKEISRSGSIRVGKVIEDESLSTSQVLRNGVQKTPYISEIVELDDGSKWIQIMHHDTKKATNLFSSGDAALTKSVFKNSDCWCDFPLINEIGLYDSKYEFFLVQEKYNGKFTRYRWSQTVNPFDATFDNTKYNSSGITQIENMPSTYGGMYKSTSEKTFFNMNNNASSNWYGAIGCYTAWSQTISGTSYAGIPGFADSDSAIAAGVVDLWMRIDPDNARYRELRGGVILTNQIYEE